MRWENQALGQGPRPDQNGGGWGMDLVQSVNEKLGGGRRVGLV